MSEKNPTSADFSLEGVDFQEKPLDVAQDFSSDIREVVLSKEQQNSLKLVEDLKGAILSNADKKVIAEILEKLKRSNKIEGFHLQEQISNEVKDLIQRFIIDNNINEAKIVEFLKNDQTFDLQTLTRAGFQRWLKRFELRFEGIAGVDTGYKIFHLPKNLQPLIHEIRELIDSYFPSGYKGN